MQIEPAIGKVLCEIADKSDSEPKFGAVIAYEADIIATGFARKAAPESPMIRFS